MKRSNCELGAVQHRFRKVTSIRQLRRWAGQVNKDTRFKASDGWVCKFNRTYQITSRKVNKFITRKTLEDKEKLKVNMENFVNDVASRRIKQTQFNLCFYSPVLFMKHKVSS